MNTKITIKICYYFKDQFLWLACYVTFTKTLSSWIKFMSSNCKISISFMMDMSHYYLIAVNQVSISRVWNSSRKKFVIIKYFIFLYKLLGKMHTFNALSISLLMRKKSKIYLYTICILIFTLNTICIQWKLRMKFKTSIQLKPYILPIG